jgi:hypothetical protein
MSTLSETSGTEFILAADLCRRLGGMTPVTLRRICARHGVELTRLSPSKHGLTQADFDILLSRAKEAGR